MKMSSLFPVDCSCIRRLRAYAFPSPGSRKNSTFFDLTCFFRYVSTSGNGSTTVILKSWEDGNVMES